MLKKKTIQVHIPSAHLDIRSNLGETMYNIAEYTLPQQCEQNSAYTI